MRVALLLLAAVGAAAADVRVRKSWAAHSDEEKALYTSAVEKAMSSGEHLRFTQLYMDDSSLGLVVNTCGAPAWYRKWLFGYESMLRSLDDGFANVTLPYWNLFEDSAKRISSQTSCSSIQECSPFLADMGGCSGPDGVYSLLGVNVIGNCANSSVAASACSDADDCEGCLPRGNWDIEDSSLEFGPTALVEALKRAGSSADSSSDSSSSIDALRASIQSNFQFSLHSILGGVYETRAAAFDPIFIGHYAAIDMVYQYFQNCNQSIALTGSCTDNNSSAITSKSTIPMTLGGVAVEKVSSLATYFTDAGTTFGDLSSQDVQYELDAFLQELLSAFSLECTSKASSSAITLSTEDSTYEDANELEDLVDAFASCSDGESSVNGSTVYEPYAFMTCELLSSLQNGVFTNFSSPVREFFRTSSSDVPKCVDALAMEASHEVTVSWSETCIDDVSSETSIDADDFVTLSTGFAVVTLGADGGVVYLNPSS